MKPKTKGLVKKTSSFKGNPEARAASFILNEKYRPLLLVGAGGVGKSEFIGEERLKNKNVIVVASTGAAAVKIQGRTIHSVFRLPRKHVLPEDLDLENISNRFTSRDREMLKTCDLIIIDEVSMLTAAAFDCLNEIVKYVCNSDKSFAGKRVLLVGDVLQLPPVLKGWNRYFIERYTSPYFFHSKVFIQMKFFTIQFKKNYRQNDNEFLDILSAIRNYSSDIKSGIKEIMQAIKKLNQVCVKPAHEGAIRIVFTKYDEHRINEEELLKLPGELHSIKANEWEDFDWSSTNVEPVLQLKIGARVMTTANHPKHRYINGTLGYVTKMTDKQITIVTDAGVTCRIGRKDHKTIGKVPEYIQFKGKRLSKLHPEGYFAGMVDRVVGRMSQYPIKLAYAIIIQKVQGSTYDKVHIVNMSSNMFLGQLYVALSRCRTMEGLTIEHPISIGSIELDMEIIRFYRRLPDFSKTIKAINDLIDRRNKQTQTADKKAA